MNKKASIRSDCIKKKNPTVPQEAILVLETKHLILSLHQTEHLIKIGNTTAFSSCL